MSEDSLAQNERRSRGDTSLLTLFKIAVSEWSDDDAATWSAAVACYAILALAPIAVLALKLLAIFTSTPAAQSQIKNITSEWMGSASGDAVSEILNRASQPGHGKWATAISLIVAIASTGGVLAELQQAMNRIWKVKVRAGNAVLAFIKARAMSSIVFLVAAFVLLASVVITSWVNQFTGSVGLGQRFVTRGIDVVASAIVATLLFALIYRTLPDVQIEWRATWVGAGISAMLFLAGKYGLAIYFRYGSPTSAFGAVGSLAAVLIWVYYSCLIVFFGAELTQVFVKFHGYSVRPSKHAQWLSKCDETETATPSKLDPAEKPLRPDEGARPASKSPRLSPQTRGASVDWNGLRPSLAADATAAATAVVAGFVVRRRYQSRQPIDAAAVDRIGREIDQLSDEIAALAIRRR
jgi:membrane protein